MEFSRRLNKNIMAESALYNALSNYNSQISNSYNNNWGSLLNFIGKLYKILNIWHVDFDDTRLLAEKAKRMMNNKQEKSKFC